MLATIKKIIRKNNLSLSENEITDLAMQYLKNIEQGKFDFTLSKKQIITQGKKKRVVYSFPNNSLENVLCGYLKEKLDRYFKVKYANRSNIVNTLFNTLPAIKDLNDFVIVRYDFKSFFDSVSTQYIYDNYIKESSISRKVKIIFQKLTKEFKYCYAGLNTSNAMTEIACRDFDKVLRAKLEPYGVVYCQRYVDDALVILNSHITKDDFLNILNNTIQEVFLKCKVKINNNKFYYIARRDIKNNQEFDFLGYNFIIEYKKGNKKPFRFRFGITEKKQKKYIAKIRQTFIEYLKNKDIELLRHRIKAFSTRVVYSLPLNGESCKWITKGITSNYNELRYHLDDLDDITEDFLKNVYFKVMDELNITTRPYFLNYNNDEESIYNLYSTLKRNRSMIFDEKIGVKINQLVCEIRKIDPFYKGNKKTYYQITNDYLNLLKIH